MSPQQIAQIRLRLERVAAQRKQEAAQAAARGAARRETLPKLATKRAGRAKKA
jgi:hypothetical protein